MIFRHTSRSYAKVPAEEVDSYLTNEQSRSQSFCITPCWHEGRECFSGFFQQITEARGRLGNRKLPGS